MNNRSNRRQRARSEADRPRVAWGPASGGVLRGAVIKDISESGVALRVLDTGAACEGGAIRVVARCKMPPRHARIVRIDAPGDADARATIGCRWITSDDRRRRHLQGHVRPVHNPFR